MITSETSGVWNLDDIYNKTKNTLYTPIVGDLYAIGSNSYGILGLNDTTNLTSFVKIPGSEWQAVDVNDSSLATKTDGTLWAWGGPNDLGGQLGLNDLVRRSSPTQIPGTQWDKICSTDIFASAATKTDGTLWSWGSGSIGNLGLNDLVARSSPTQITGTQWSFIGGRKNFFAIKTNGTLWVWGGGEYGKLGLNDQVQRSSPVQLPGTQWVFATGSNYDNNAFGLKSDGTLWAWGENGVGVSAPALGLNDQVQRSSPTQVPGTEWSSIAVGTRGAMVATKNDGTLWTWGSDFYGDLALNTTNINRSSPTQVPGTEWATGFYQVASSYFIQFAIKTDGSLWAWGDSGYVTPKRSSPIQLPGTGWNRIVTNQPGSAFAISSYTPPSQ